MKTFIEKKETLRKKDNKKFDDIDSESTLKKTSAFEIKDTTQQDHNKNDGY